MDCTDIKALLSALIDDEIDMQRRHDAERHFAECGPCRDLLSASEAIDDGFVDAVEQEYATQELPARFESQVLSATVYARPLRPYLARWTSWTGWLAAAACLTLAATIWMMDRTPRREPAPHSAARSAATLASTNYQVGGELRSQVQLGNLPVQVYALPAPADAVSRAMPADSSAPSPERAADQIDEAIASSAISQDDAETLYAASLLMDMLARADDASASFAHAERVRQIAEYDDLMPRLTRARASVREEDQPLIMAAESILLRVVRGPVSDVDLQVLRQDADSLDLATRLQALSNRWKPNSV